MKNEIRGLRGSIRIDHGPVWVRIEPAEVALFIVNELLDAVVPMKPTHDSSPGFRGAHKKQSNTFGV